MADAVGDKPAAGRWRKIIAKGRAAYAGYFDPKQGYYKAKCTAAEMLRRVHRRLAVILAQPVTLTTGQKIKDRRRKT
jgi:hypothetical protein